jgi:hypothetical protein
MRILTSLPLLLLMSALAWTGCSKQDKGAPKPSSALNALPQFAAAFTSATPDQKLQYAAAYRAVRYSQFPEALEALNKLASDARLTETQKQAVNNMIQFVNGSISNAPAAPSR